jgi:hypothetical protein
MFVMARQFVFATPGREDEPVMYGAAKETAPCIQKKGGSSS